MHKQMSITLDKAVYDGLDKTIGKCGIRQFIENLVRPYLLDTSLDEGYQAMALDKDREAEVSECCHSLVPDP